MLQMHRGIRYIHRRISNMVNVNKVDQALIEKVSDRLLEIIKNDKYDLSIRGESAITLLKMISIFGVEDDEDMVLNVMSFLVYSFSSFWCKLIIQHNNNSIYNSDVSIQVLFNGGYVDTIDINIIDLL